MHQVQGFMMGMTLASLRFFVLMQGALYFPAGADGWGKAAPRYVCCIT